MASHSSILFPWQKAFVCFLVFNHLIPLVSKAMHHYQCKPGSDGRAEQTSTSFNSAHPNPLPLQSLFITEYVISEMKKVSPKGLQYCSSFMRL